MTDIRNRPSALLRRMVSCLRGALFTTVLDAINTDLGSEVARYTLPTFDDENIDRALRVEALPEFTEAPSILVAPLDSSKDLSSPPSVADRTTQMLVRVYLNFDDLPLNGAFVGTENDEATLTDALEDAGHVVERVLDDFSSNGGLRGWAGADDVQIQQMVPQIHAPADDADGRIRSGTVDVLVVVNQEGLA